MTTDACIGTCNRINILPHVVTKCVVSLNWALMNKIQPSSMHNFKLSPRNWHGDYFLIMFNCLFMFQVSFLVLVLFLLIYYSLAIRGISPISWKASMLGSLPVSCCVMAKVFQTITDQYAICTTLPALRPFQHICEIGAGMWRSWTTGSPNRGTTLLTLYLA